MNRRTKDRCPACNRNGLVVEDKHKEQRRRCSLCYQEEPRPTDRIVHLACVSDVHFVEGKGVFLGGGWFVTPFASRKEAQGYLDAYVADVVRRWGVTGRVCKTEPLTASGHAGTGIYTNSGPQIVFIQEKIMDCSAILRSG